jgi:palmitoyltransferase
MAGTSLNLAALNLTQVERLGGKTKVYILAILNTSSDRHDPTNSLGRITYPLGANRAPVTKANGSTQLPQNLNSPQQREACIVPADPSAGTAVPSPQPQVPQPDSLQDAPIPAPASQQQPILSQENERPVLGESAAEPSPQYPGLAQDAALPARSDRTHPKPISAGNKRPREPLSARDLKATRTFTIVKMLEPGDNPWDLGSAHRNLETVMGTSILDWLLPIRRSPCCNHENNESQFAIGPKVASLRASLDPNQSAQYPPNERNSVLMSSLN